MAACGAYFENLEDRPGGRKFDPSTGKTWYPTDNPCKYCTEENGEGECFEAIVPGGNKPENIDPRVTPLAKFPRWPVEYYVVEHVGDTWSRVLRRRDYPTRPINRQWLPSWEEMASTWISRAQALATTPNRQAWIDRLKDDLLRYADGTPIPCLVDCRYEMGRIWLVANAAQYLARAWGDTDSPPLLNTRSPSDRMTRLFYLSLIAGLLGLGAYVAYRVRK